MSAVTGLLRDPQRLLHGVVLGLWIAQPFALGPLLDDALSATTDPFRTTVSIGAWLGWFLILVAMVVARPVTLTIVRICVPAALPIAVWAAFDVGDNTTILVGILSAAVAGLVVLLPGLGDRFVDGVSYGDERRFLLRAPGPIVVSVLVPTWAVTVVGVLVGPLLLADERWLAGGLALIVGFPIAALGVRAMHRLTARFVVFVPNGFVIHDGAAMREPVLFADREIAALAPAAADTTATDFTAQALGLALELRLRAPVKLPVVVDASTTTEELVQSMLISPTRPAAVMRFAQERGLPIG